MEEAPDLLLRPAPGRREGPQGYRLRLAEVNCMTFRDMEHLGFRFDHSFMGIQRLLPPAALDPDLHAHVARVAQLLHTQRRIWNPRYARFCPKCLAEEPVWRAAWEILFYDVCPTHGVWLIDRCSSCGREVRWLRDSLVRCQCGSDLRAEYTGRAPASILQLASVLETRLLGHPDDGAFPLAGLDVEQIQRLIRYLGGYMDPVRGRKPLKLRNAGALEASWPVTSLAAEILAGWPQRFDACWTRIQERAPGEKAGLTGIFHQAYSYLYKGLKEDAFAPVRESFETWLGEHWKGGVCRRNRRLTARLLASAHWIPGKVAADELGVSVNRLRGLVKEGLLDGQDSVSQMGRRFLMVRRDDVHRAASRLAGEMTLAEAIALLGMGKVRMRGMLRLLFPGARRIGDRNGMPWCVPRGEVERLLSLGAHLPVVSIPEEQEVSLAHVLRYWTWTAEEIVMLVEAVRAGSFLPTSLLDSGTGITGWIFGAAGLRAWHASLDRNRAWLSIPEVAKVVGVKQEVAYWLVRNGFIPASEELAGPKAGARVNRRDLAEFRKAHIFGTEIAALVGSTSRKVAHLLAERGIHPLSGYTRQQCRQLVYPRTGQLEQLLGELSGDLVGSLVHPNSDKQETKGE